MSIFPDTIKAYLAGHVVRCSFLTMFDFTSAPVRVWTGAGRIVAGGSTWEGLGSLAQISGLEQAINGQAPETSFILSGINSTILMTARDEFETEAKRRLVQVYIQFHNDADDLPMTLYDAPYPLWSGKIRTARFESQADGLRQITIGAESLFALRSRPNSSMYTDSDQQKRFPGDFGFEFVPTLMNKVIRWPDF